MSDDNRFEATYQTYDGYAGGSRPQHFEIRADDLEEDMGDNELESLFEQSMREHFQQNIYPEGYGSSLEGFKAWARQKLAEREVDA